MDVFWLWNPFYKRILCTTFKTALQPLVCEGTMCWAVSALLSPWGVWRHLPWLFPVNHLFLVPGQWEEAVGLSSSPKAHRIHPISIYSWRSWTQGKILLFRFEPVVGSSLARALSIFSLHSCRVQYFCQVLFIARLEKKSYQKKLEREERPRQTRVWALFLIENDNQNHFSCIQLSFCYSQ